MTFYDNENNGKLDKDVSSDGYDYLDSLMSDVMGMGESEDDNKVDKESPVSSNEGDSEDNKDLSVSNEEGSVSESSLTSESSTDTGKDNKSSGVKTKRAPLFKQLGIGSYDRKDDEEDSHSKSGIVKNEDESEDEADNEVVDDKSEDDKSGDESDSWGLEDDKDYSIDNEEDTNEEDSYDDNHLDKDEEAVLDSDGDSPDLIDGMLEELASVDDESDIIETVSNLDKDVEVPLQTKEMSEVKVTPDGRTLSEMIPGLRSGNRSVNQVVQEIRQQDKVVEVGDKKFSDDRYLKHVSKIEDKRAAQDERRKLSNKFLQRNAKFTEQEKIIMENLGVNNEQFVKLMGAKELSKKQKEEIIALGKYGSEKYFKGRRYRTTVGDSAMLEFLVKFKFANTRILRWISNEPQGRTWRKLNRLRNNGLVESKSLIGIPDLWGATPAGVAISGHSYVPGLRPMPKMITVSSSMGINYIAACLWFNSVNVLNLDDFPAHNRVIPVQSDGRDRVRGEMLVSELEIRSSLGKEINPQSTTMQTLGDERLYDVISSNVREEFSRWKEGGKVGESPEFAIGNEYMWILYPTSNLTLSYHVPDLVVRRPRGPNGEPRSIAVEMERYEKDLHRYDKTMLAYKLDEHLYEQVIWVTPNTRVARALERSANNVGFENYSIVPIITETGVYDKPDIWMI